MNQQTGGKERKAERQDRKKTCAQGIYNSVYMSLSIWKVLFNFNTLLTYVCLNEIKTISLSHACISIFLLLFNSHCFKKIEGE